ncbi:hypothetical protein DRW41_21930 [Neobacillus piezotolerans]|uniref:Uncharacterized protein n=1 Tax=Neobacillus piezotolerans TaxID=2259171 RepID=A0A3D8GKD5_9BACI|nr:hypothetical protein [Neobacillus piezotolerans]RDU34757.1 hypothetical protein DRW41_21930 [Neobacillus piezotolerans]
MNLGPYWEDPLANNVIPSVILPLITIFSFMFYPEKSDTAVIVGLIASLVLVAASVITKVKNLQYYLNWRLGVMMLFIDSAMIFMALTISRAYGKFLPCILLLLLMLIAIVLSHKFAERYLDELHSPKTKLGKMIILIGFIGSGGGAMIGYISTQTIGAHIAAPIIFIVALIVVGFIHARFQLVAIEKKYEAFDR